ncbi:MAG TPA: archease [Vicinamibacterales bacterium]|nr:archease [Vicinamibacterales bacterium]
MDGPAFEFIEHTADIAARLRAPTAAGLFEAAAAALTEALTDRAAIRPAQERVVELSAPELELLLVDWLAELLFVFEIDGLLVADARVTIDGGGPHRLRATVRGEPRDALRHPLKLLIKGVTYHGLRVTRTEEGYEATVIFDI